MFEFGPIVRTLWRNKTGAILIIIQTALTLGIVANAAFVVDQRRQIIERPTGIDDQHLFSLQLAPLSETSFSYQDVQRDLHEIRRLPGVIDASFSNTSPLSNSGSSSDMTNEEDPQKPMAAMVELYSTDSHGLNTLGLTLLSGRFLEEQEVTASSSFEDGSNSIKAVVLSRSLADKLYGKDVDPTGKLLNGLPVVGVVASAMVSYVAPGYTDGVAFIPRFATNYPPNYVIRCQPQQCEQLMVKVPELLEKLDPNRMVRNVRTMADNKHNSYRRDRSMVVMMTATIILVSAVTGLGIVGLTLLWVNQRRKQIGIRRALGATQLAIIRYFLLENVVITGIGIVVGVIISLAINQLMVQHYSMTALPVSYLLSGMVAVWLLGLLAALMPAWRTIRISPALATRNI